MLSRRALLLSPVVVAAGARVSPAQGAMTLAMHQNTSAGAGYRGSLEGWARAGIRHVELNPALVNGFLGEIAHVHFQDVPDMPRELLTSRTRAIPGDGVAPLVHVLRTLQAKSYAGPLSVELFLYQEADPYELAREIREKAEAVMQEAGVM